MFNIIKPTKKFTFVTHDEMVYEYFKIAPGHRYFPEWWKTLPKDLYAQDIYDNIRVPKSESSKLLTTKSCPGITDLYKKSYIMPLWCEIDINISADTVDVKVSDKMTRIGSHNPHQRGSFLNDKIYKHLKIDTPWKVETKSSISFLISACMFSNENLINRLSIPNGIRSFDISSSTNIHGFVTKEEKNINIKAGTPIIHLFPLTDSNIKIECKFDPEKYQHLNKTQPDRFSFANAYYTKKKLMKETRASR